MRSQFDKLKQKMLKLMVDNSKLPWVKQAMLRDILPAAALANEDWVHPVEAMQALFKKLDTREAQDECARAETVDLLDALFVSLGARFPAGGEKAQFCGLPD